MKKPDPEFAIIKLSLEAWREQVAKDNMNPEDIGLQETKDEINRLHRKELAGRVYQAIKDCKFTKRQLEVFALYVELRESAKVAGELGVSRQYVENIVNNIRKGVIGKMGNEVN